MRKLILGTGLGFNVPVEEQILRIKSAGWDGVFTDISDGDQTELAKLIRREGLIHQSVHAKFNHAHHLWEEQELGEEEVKAQQAAIEACARADVDILIMHTIIGMERCTPNDLGVERYGRIFDTAEKYGVKIALENTEGEEYLERLLREYADRDIVRFCIDTGHEMCYNRHRDLITKYGHKLVSTHLNDNMGVTGESLTWWDDSHLLPFDGIADWEGIAKRLKAVGYEGPLTFELTSRNKPNRNTHDRYANLDFDGFVSLAHDRAVRFAELFEKV